MARFDADGFDALIKEMEAEGADIGPRADRVLLAGAEEVKKAWQAAADEFGLRRTGKMIAAIGYSTKVQRVSEARVVEIYPQGTGTYTDKGSKTPRTVRHAEKAYILHWGTTSSAALRRRKEKKFTGPGIPRTLWVDRAEEIAEAPAVEAMQKAWEEEK